MLLISWFAVLHLFQEAFGKRAPNIILSDISKECAKYQEGLTKGGQSNMDLHKAMQTHIANLKLLAEPPAELEKQLPSVEDSRSKSYCQLP